MQVISFIPLTASAVYLFIRSRQIERRLKTLSRTLSDRPAALAIGLGQDIEKAVRQHLKDNNLELELLSLTRPGMVAPAEFSQLLADVKVETATFRYWRYRSECILFRTGHFCRHGRGDAG